jgi:hypothetical protein
LIVLLALVLTGVMLGQIVRRAAHMAEEYAERIAAGDCPDFRQSNRDAVPTDHDGENGTVPFGTQEDAP